MSNNCKEQSHALHDDLLSKHKQFVLTTKSKRLTPTQKTQHFLRKRICVLNWIGKYNVEWGINDIIAGITLGLTIIPESIACALLAGLPPHYGLCSAFIGCFIYLILGSIDNVIIGPTSLVALVSVQFTIGKPIEFAFILTFLSGVVQVIMSVLQMGFIFEFISTPVIKAFSSATAVLVIESQLKVLLGIKYLVAGFIESVKTLLLRYSEASIGDLAMGLSAILFLIGFGFLEKISHKSNVNKFGRVFCKYLAFSRNTLIVLITATVSYIWLEVDNHVPYTLSKNTVSGLPNITMPSFNIESEEKSYNFWQILSELNIGIIVIPIIGVLTNISIGKLTPKGKVDNNQELATLGLCNIFGSFVQAMPSSGAFSRYAISTACGLKTPMANLYSGVIVLLALSYLSPYFNYIPEPTLAAILICSLFTLLDLKLPLRLWHESKRDFGIWLICFVVCVLCGVERGLFVSIIINALYLLYLWARPEISVKINEIDNMSYVCVTPRNGIYFPSINYLRDKILKAATQTEFKIPIVLDCHKVNGDFTGAQGIAKLVKELQAHADGDDNSKGEDCRSEILFIIYRLEKSLQRMIDNVDNLLFCEEESEISELFSQEFARNGCIKLKEPLRNSRDHKIDFFEQTTTTTISANMTGGDSKEQTQILREDLLSPNPTHIIFHNKSGRSSSAAHKVEHFFHKHIFIFNWIGKYNLVWGINDAIAGITLGLTIIPESIACALLAGLPARYGLCSAFIGSFIYVFLGSIDKVIIGPTSLVALVSVQFTLGKPIEFAFILTFLCGVVQVLMSLLQMGYIFEFISTPIIKAFSTATAVLVIVSQLKVLMGINFVVPGFIKTVKTLVLRYQETNIGDLSMGLAVILFLLLFEPLEKFSYILITALVTYIWLEKEFQVPYTLSENALSGLPNITLPDFHIESEDKFYNFWDIVKELNVGIIVVPIIGVLTNISIGKLNPRGTVNNNQELATLGLCNIFGSFVQAMPTAGGFTRYAISNHCGLKTPMANLYSGIIVLLALGYLSPYLYYIPEATLAAILIYSISSLLDFKLPQRLWHESKWDFVKWLICFLVCVLCGVEVGLLMGVIINIAYLLFLWARPEMDIKFKEMDGKPFISVTPGNGIYFPAINYLCAKVLKVASQTDFKITVVMDCHKVNGLDFTGSQGIVKLAKGLQANPDEMESHTSQGEKCESDVLLIIYKLKTPLHRLIDPVDNLVYCENEDEIRELLTQKSIRKCGWHRIDVHD
ncbi:LOW QUALITY PROTEIN: uncharacterized protein ACRADG_010964 [Cochliomyia hominivorax]